MSEGKAAGGRVRSIATGKAATPARTALALLLVAGCASPALAAEGHAAPTEALLPAEVAVLGVLARLLGELMIRIGQPAVMGHLIAGILLGPSCFGLLWPEAQHLLFPPNPLQKSMISGLAQFGILMLLLLAGM